MKLIFEQLGKPKQLYSDEPSLRSKELVIFVNGNNIKTIQALTHAHTIERFIKIIHLHTTYIEDWAV